MTGSKLSTGASIEGLADKIVLAHLGDNQGTVDRLLVVGSRSEATVGGLLGIFEGQIDIFLGKNVGAKTRARVGDTLIYDAIGTSWRVQESVLDVAKVDSKPDQTAEQTNFLIHALGSGAELARLLGVNRSQPTQWRTGKEKPGPEARRNLLDLYYVISKALEVYPAKAAVDWLNGNNAYLDGARPIDVLKLHGSRDVVQALEVAMA